MAVTHQHQPPPGPTNHPSVSPKNPPSENPIPKRHRRPSVRLGEIGDQPAAALTKAHKLTAGKSSRTRPLTNLSSDDNHRENPADNTNHHHHHHHENNNNNNNNVSIGSWKMKGSKSKRPRTNWVSRIDDGFARDSENEGHSLENEKELNFRVSGDEDEDEVEGVGDGDGVELDGEDENEGGQSVRRWGRNDGVRVWLNGLGLGRYWPVFKIHEVDEEVLPLLTLEDLKDMGINAVGSRRKMYCAIQKLNEVFS